MLQSMRSAAKYIWIFIVVVFIGVFLFTETSGLLGRARMTTGTAVAKVNGDEIPYTTWVQAAQQRIQQEQEGRGRSLTLDEEEQIRNDVFNQLVQSMLLDQEYKRRGIRVTDEEIVQAAQFSPPPQFMQSPELQTDGRFDLEKYQRFLKSAAARQQGLYFQLENYYRTEIPRRSCTSRSRRKCSSRTMSSGAPTATSTIRRRSASSASTRPRSPTPASLSRTPRSVRTTTSHKKELERPGRAVVSILSIPAS